MPSVTLTSKRQATFPKDLCDELDLRPGDLLDLERRIIDGGPVWVLKPHRPDWSWLGAARPADGPWSHDLDEIRESAGRGRVAELAEDEDA